MFSALNRQCGECTACCTAIGVGDLGKPFNVPCKLLCDKGCGVYGRHPESCHDYQCGWLIGMYDHAHRPDKVGFLFHATEEDGKFWIDVFILRKDIDDRLLYSLTNHMIQTTDAVGARFVRWDQVMNAAWPIDLKTYPGCENIGEGTTWVTTDHVFLFLDAPKRYPLKLATDETVKDSK